MSRDSCDLLIVGAGINGAGIARDAERLRARWPDLRILFMSGYAGDALERHSLVASEEAFLQKPFSLKDLTGKVRAVLDGDGKPGGGRSAG